MLDGLSAVHGFNFPVYASDGLTERAMSDAQRLARAEAFLSERLGQTAHFTLFVLTAADWDGRAATAVYGLPNSHQGNIFIAGQRSDFWAGLAQLLPGMEHAYGNPVDLTPYFDLNSVHELAHVHHEQAGIEFPAMWQRELFCNVALHEYVLKREPALLPTLETFPARLATAELPVTSRELSDFEQVNDMITFAWYQCRLNVAAKRIVDASGGAALSRLWTDLHAGRTLNSLSAYCA